MTAAPVAASRTFPPLWRPESRAAIAARWMVSLLLLATLVAVFVPFTPVMPGAGLDPSWRHATNQAVSQHIAFGTGLIFTFGPYGAIYTKMFHPATDGLMLGGSLLLAVGYWTGLALLLRSTRWPWPLLFGAFLAGGVVLRDPLLFSYPLLVALVVYHGILAEGQSLPDRRYVPWVFALLFAPLGLLPLVKGSTVVPCAAIGGLCVLAFVARRYLAVAAACVAAPLLTLVAGWLLAGQRLEALPGYFTGMAPIVSGYTEAMAVDGDLHDVWFYLAASALLLLSILVQSSIDRRARAFLLLVFALYLFITFKAGFVRHDGHAVIAGTGIVFAALLLPFAFANWGTPLVIALALCAWWQVDHQWVKTTPRGFADAVVATYADAWNGLRQRMARDGWPRTAYKSAVGAVRAQGRLPFLPGTSDIYPFDQAYLLASGNDWSPRPVLQSYSAYTPALAEADRRFLLGPRAPDNVFFSVQPLDDRIPSLEDGASWPVLLQRYKPVRMRNGFLILRKIPHAAAYVEPRPIASGRYQLGERIALPASRQPLYAQLDLQPTLAGRIAGIVYKPSQLQIQLEMADGSTKPFRMVAGMARSGFLISPLVENTTEFGKLYGGHGLPDDRRVVAMRMYVPGRGSRMWQPGFGFALSRIEAIATTNVSALDDYDPFDAALSDAPSKAEAHCEGSIDLVGGSAPPASIVASGSLRVDGWLAASASDGRLADAIYVVLTDAHGHRSWLTTHALPRPDLASAFHHPQMASAGFSTTGSLARLAGNQELSLGMRSAGVLTTCANIRIPIRIGK